MRALRYHGNKDIRLDDVPEPECKPGWIKLRNGFTGICGTGESVHLLTLCADLLEPKADNQLIIRPS